MKLQKMPKGFVSDLSPQLPRIKKQRYSAKPRSFERLHEEALHNVANGASSLSFHPKQNEWQLEPVTDSFQKGECLELRQCMPGRPVFVVLHDGCVEHVNLDNTVFGWA